MTVKKHPVLRLIEQGEGLHLDFKFEVSDAPKIARSLVAFANTDSGTLLIGVKDNRKTAGRFCPARTNKNGNHRRRGTFLFGKYAGAGIKPLEKKKNIARFGVTAAIIILSAQ